MAQYHLNPVTGVPGRCEDVDACPVGKPASAHYESRDAAFAAYETQNNESKTVLDFAITELSGEVKTSVKSATIPAGRYWFGDPAYALNHRDAEWQEWVRVAGETSHDFADPIAGANYDEWPVVSVSTLYGDGVYEDGDGGSYPVDSGSLAPVPADLIEAVGADREKLDSRGTWLDLARCTKLTRNEGGQIKFGELVIETGDQG